VAAKSQASGEQTDLTLFEDYFIGKPPTPRTKLLKAFDGAATTSISEERLNQLANAIARKPGSLTKLVTLIQEDGTTNPNLHNLLLTLSEAVIRTYGSVSLPQSANASTFAVELREWLHRRSKKPMTKQFSNELILLVLVGLHKGWVSSDEAADIMLSTTKDVGMSPLQITHSLLQLWSTDPSQQILFAQLATLRASADALQENIEALEVRIARLAAARNEYRLKVEELTSDIRDYEAREKEASERIDQLQHEARESRASYLHELRTSKEQTRGMLSDPILRWITTSLTAIRTSPPRIHVAEERLQDAVDMIKRELE